jgi:hypothetical protein
MLGMVLGAAGHDVGHPGRFIIGRKSSQHCLVGWRVCSSQLCPCKSGLLDARCSISGSGMHICTTCGLRYCHDADATSSLVTPGRQVTDQHAYLCFVSGF